MSLPLGVSSGDPGGVGPEVAMRACVSTCAQLGAVIYGDAEVMRERASAWGIDAGRLRDVAVGEERALPQGTVGLCDVGPRWTPAALAHSPTAQGGRAQLAALDAAIDAARAGRVRALVTAPMSKEAVNLGGAAFTGHTEHLARAVGLHDDDVTMMFLGPRLRVALVTTHLAVADLPAAITRARVTRTVGHLAEVLLALRKPDESAPRLVVTGLNPHAGEGGLFGSEEASAIEPAMIGLAKCPPFASRGIVLEGPMPAEAAFRMASAGEVGGVVAMMHDQATIASKLLDWTQAVNVTWGLPFVRTSVDHGVAYDAAASGSVDPRGMQSALELAQLLTSTG